MRGFALSDSLMALAIVSLLFVVMLSRGPDLEAREAERRTEAFGVDCRTLRLTPNRSHACRYWELSTDGSMGAGREGCWPESAVRAFAGHSSPS